MSIFLVYCGTQPGNRHSAMAHAYEPCGNLNHCIFTQFFLRKQYVQVASPGAGGQGRRCLTTVRRPGHPHMPATLSPCPCPTRAPTTFRYFVLCDRRDFYEKGQALVLYCTGLAGGGDLM